MKKQTDEKGNPLTYWGGLEEPKQFIDCKCTNALEVENCTRNCGYGEEPKQETLGGVAPVYMKGWGGITNSENSFNRGVKWQQEQDKNKYSEEEVLEQLNLLMSLPSSTLDKFTDDNGDITMEWFEQFKKK